ncbi:MAG: hypothetical protein LJF15_15755 [Acidobacteria bacterium]|jgi:hypothetical protein|nr:hypothetical protein [Acidobacteriota bacterium]
MSTVRALLGLGVLVASGFLGLMLFVTDGHFVAQTPDLYVVAQYARAMAEGHPFEYNAGEAPTSGATSVLHTAILAVAHAVGARGEGLVAFAVLFGTALYLASILLAHRVASRLAGPREGLLAGALVALGGPVVWAYLYGSDIALFLFLALLVLDRWLAFWREGRAEGFALAGSALALARPEGLPVALALGTASLLRPAGSPRQRLLPWIPAVVGLALVVALRIITGSWLGTSVADKALLPSYGIVHTLDVAAKYGVDVVRGLLLGLYPSEAPIGFSAGQAAFAFPPLGLLFILLAAVRPPAEARVPLRVWLVVVAAVFALVGPNIFMGVQFNRYLMWAFPGFFALVAVGLGIATRLVARDDVGLERALFRAVAGLFLALGLLSTVRFAAVYAEMAASTWRREIPTAEWIRRNLPPGVAIANGATSIEYLTGHRNLNLHGVTSPGFGGTRTVEREAGYFEALGRLPPSERPPYLLIPRSGFDSSVLVPLLADGPPIFETVSLGDDFLLFRARWDLLDRGGRLYRPESLARVAALEEVDRLNVCDHEDEAEHGYRVRSRRGDLVLGGSVRIDDYPLPGGNVTVADGGRVILGHESFRVRARPGRPLVVVLRSHPDVEVKVLGSHGGLVRELEISEARLVVEAQGREVARLELANAPGWNEHVFEIPGDALGEGATELRLSGQYTAFRYWFFQPRR